MTDKMREEFEEWFLSEVDGSAIAESLCWDAWQASRASLVVELPKGDGDECGCVVSLADVEDALDAAGVKYNG